MNETNGKSADSIVIDQSLLIAQAEKQRDDYLAMLKEKQAEFENYQKRAARERDEERKYWNRAIAADLLPALDNLDRAIAAATNDASPLVQGVTGTQKQLLDILARHGVQRMEVVPGTPFNANEHEAVMQQPSPEVPAGAVIQVFAAGYKIHDRILRPAAVAVSSGPPG
jgi:molecular chaperone GrpE